MKKQTFEPPKTFSHNKKTYKYIETKNTNLKGETLSEKCYWYEVNGKREPLSMGNLEAMVTIA